MKTTHDLAIELFALPDIPILVEGWCNRTGFAIKAVLTQYDPEHFAMLIQAPLEEREATNAITRHLPASD